MSTPAGKLRKPCIPETLSSRASPIPDESRTAVRQEAALVDPLEIEGRPVLLDDAMQADDETLFHLINLAPTRRRPRGESPAFVARCPAREGLESRHRASTAACACPRSVGNPLFRTRGICYGERA